MTQDVESQRALFLEIVVSNRAGLTERAAQILPTRQHAEDIVQDAIVKSCENSTRLVACCSGAYSRPTVSDWNSLRSVEAVLETGFPSADDRMALALARFDLRRKAPETRALAAVESRDDNGDIEPCRAATWDVRRNYADDSLHSAGCSRMLDE